MITVGVTGETPSAEGQHFVTRPVRGHRGLNRETALTLDSQQGDSTHRAAWGLCRVGGSWAAERDSGSLLLGG